MSAPCRLGCPDTRVFLTDFCGRNILADLTDGASFHRWTRLLSDDSEVELTLHISGSDAAACCEALSWARTWRNEIMVMRGDEIVWGPGPIVTIKIQREIATIAARDAFAWLDVRLVHNDYSFKHVDLATIARDVAVDALTEGPAASIPLRDRDCAILGGATFAETGKFTDLEVKANQQTAGEVIRNLTQQGLDFTVVGRGLTVGADFAWGPIGPLRESDIAGDVEVTEHGLAAATLWAMTGNGATGTCGGPDPTYGLIERGVESGTEATTVADAARAACDRLKFTNPPPLTLNIPSDSFLTQDAPVCPRELVPGSLVDLAFGEMCRPAVIQQRLTAVDFTLDENGERPSITIGPASNLQLEQEDQ